MKRLPMRKIGEALRLRAAGLSTRKIAASLGVGQSTVSEYLKRATQAGLSWPLPAGVSEATRAVNTRPRPARRTTSHQTRAANSCHPPSRWGLDGS